MNSVVRASRPGGLGFEAARATAGNVPIGYDRGHDGGADHSDPKATRPRFRTLCGAVRNRDLARRFAIAEIGAISIAFGILLIFELAFGRGNLPAG